MKSLKSKAWIREPRAGSAGLQEVQQLIARLSATKDTPRPGIVNISVAGRSSSWIDLDPIRAFPA
jgi:hypothetical protein